MAYSIDYRRRAVEYKDSGHTFEELREAFKIPCITYYDWMEKLENGYYERDAKRERRRKIDRERLRRAAAENPDACLYELAQQFGCTPQAVFYMLKKMKITLKKRLLPMRKSPKNSAANILLN